MRFGGFNFFPLMLGGDLSCSQFSSLAHTVAETKRTTSVVMIRVNTASGVSGAVTKDGSGIDYYPTFTSLGVGECKIEFNADNIVSVQVTPLAFAHARAYIVEKGVVVLEARDQAGFGSDVDLFVTVHVAQEVKLTSYGLSVDKEDSELGDTSLVQGYYQNVESNLGNAYTTSFASYVFGRKIALARMLAGQHLFDLRVAYNALPGTSWERLGFWCEVLGVLGTDNKHETRLLCAQKYMIQDNTLSGVEVVARNVLGDNFDSVVVFVGSQINMPPEPTWPKPVPVDGPMTSAPPYLDPYKLSPSGQVWLSRRRHIVVTAKDVPGVTLFDLQGKIEKLSSLLDIKLASTATFKIGRVSSGMSHFRCDYSKLDLDLLTN